ncbi:MAG: GNAT family N-acetyltransferase [Candidatus Promineofilum sp.]|uniref:GNAT family N-acetyltransferase n=1 Tax=Promineifilum sp. TaxID=2664178 RepID=UPI00241204E1|nr:GNAT family N-acetyltransferase [Promineifilum sp.]
MRTIREIHEDELDELIRITVEAFPGMKVESRADRDRMRERLAKVMNEPIVHFFGVFEGAAMIGVMRCYDFTMKLRETRALVGGLGGVAVDLRHKKEHVAADMVRFYLDYYRQKGAALTALYPFRPDFYHRMGFGYGVKMNRYSFRPDALPAAGVGAVVDYLTADDRDDLAACYERFLARTTGLIELPPHMLDALFDDTSARIVGYRQNGALRGYLVFRFEAAPGENWLTNNIQLRTLIYDDAAALLALLGFLRKQADQAGRIIYETQDETFHYLLDDPRDDSGNLLAGLWHQANTQGLGIMYRVIDAARLWAVLGDHDFGGVTLRMRLDLTDTFFPENAGSYLINVSEGRATLGSGTADVELGMDIADFSSLVVGAVDFERLQAYGRVNLSDAGMANVVNRFFAAGRRPWCLTHF